MSDGFKLMIILLVWLCCVVAISYGMATIGHPTAVWLWRDIFGVLQTGASQ